MRKVSMAVAEVAAGLAESVNLRNLNSRRDWGFAPDYVEAMRRMLQAEEPRDYVIATGEAHTVQDVCETAFGHVGLDWQHHVIVTPDTGPPREENLRIGDASRARADLGWAPTVSFSELVTLMVDADRSLINGSRSSNPSGNVFTD
jgi:GDPmannose 4,6-dehydratase